ncbi:MAG TPA: SH3 domain-containing protein [Chloroflexota bacterium]
MRRIGQVRGTRSTGQLERLLVIGLGALLVLLVQLPPFAGLRSAQGAANGRSAAAATPVSTPLPTPAPLEAVAPARPADEAAPEPAPARSPTADPPTYTVVAGGAGANLRGAPSTSAPVLTRVRDGAELKNLDEQRQADGQLWRRVADGPTEGWIAAELLTPGQ